MRSREACRQWGFGLTLVAALGSAACSGEDPTTKTGEGSARAPTPSTAAAQPSFTEVRPGIFRTEIVSQGLKVDVERQGAVVSPLLTAGRRRPVGLLTTTAFGCEGTPEPTRAGAARHDGDRISRALAPGVDEWFATSSAGLEHGYHVRETRCSGRLEARVELRGAALEARADGVVAAFRGLARPLTYSKLRAWDATGRELASELQLDGSQVRLLVDVVGAELPVVVDPILASNEVEILTDSPRVGEDAGRTVAIDGDWAYVGVPKFDGGRGVVYAFEQVAADTWVKRARIEASDGATGDNFGSSIDVQGTTLVVGAELRDSNSSIEGAAYVYSRSGSTFTETQTIVPVPSLGFWPKVGHSISLDGNTLLVGCVDDLVGPFGIPCRAWVFRESGGAWTQETELAPADSAPVGFGGAVGVDGNVAVVGAYFENGGNGAIYIYERPDDATPFGAPTRVELTDDMGEFGTAVAVEGGVVFASAPYSDDPGGGGVFTGVVSSFDKSGGTWAPQSSVTGNDFFSGFGKQIQFTANRGIVSDESATTFNSFDGRAHALVRVGSFIVIEQGLIATQPAENAEYGAGVGVSGDNFIVGAPSDPSGNWAYIRTHQTGTFGHIELPLADAEKLEGYGGEIAVDGDLMIAGAGSARVGGVTRGRAVAFERINGAWKQTQLLESPDPKGSSPQFGRSVAVSGNRALISEPRIANGFTGSAFVYERQAGAWAHVDELQGSQSMDWNDRFGTDLAIDGARAVVGAPSFGGPIIPHVYVFEDQGSGWAEAAFLPAPTGATSFGANVDLDGDTLVVGAHEAGITGRAWVYELSGGTWTGTELTPSTPPGGGFGQDVQVLGSTILVGDRFDAEGRVHVFEKSAGSWSATQVLTPSGAGAEFFGAEIQLLDGLALIGAPLETTTQVNAGAAYVFALEGGSWVQQDRIVPSVAQANASFSRGLALTRTQAILGGSGYTVPGADAGRIWTYDLKRTDGIGCALGAECVTGFCVEGVCCDSACGGECDTCVAARGAPEDGTCAVVAAGSPGDPACPSPFACNGTDAACPGACASTDDCAAAFYCDTTNGNCVDRFPQGSACSAGEECLSSFCEDGVCCDRECGECQACTAAKKGDSGIDGVCGNIPADTDPDDDCDAAPPDNACGPDGLCGGNGRCRDFATSTTPCGETLCVAGAVSGLRCSGGGQCITGAAPVACAPFVCANEQVCSTTCDTDEDCDPITGWCFDDGAGSKACQDRRALGDGCERGEQCLSNFCADGVCCTAPCQGICEYCAVPEAEGICTPVSGQPRREGESCPQQEPSQPCSQSICDGNITTACAGFVGSSVDCAEERCEGGKAFPAAVCNGTGTCPSLDGVDCGAYVCGATSCLSSCESDVDCSGNNVCLDGECSIASTCSDNGLEVDPPEGPNRSCAPYRCSAGVCIAQCSSGADCAPGFSCSADSECVPVASSSSSGAGDSGGCGCSVPDSRRSRLPALPVVLGVSLFASLARRRRRRCLTAL